MGILTCTRQASKLLTEQWRHALIKVGTDLAIDRLSILRRSLPAYRLSTVAWPVMPAAVAWYERLTRWSLFGVSIFTGVRLPHASDRRSA